MVGGNSSLRALTTELCPSNMRIVLTLTVPATILNCPPNIIAGQPSRPELCQIRVDEFMEVQIFSIASLD